MKRRPTILGVINVSPESFYKGSVKQHAAALSKAAEQMEQDGADAIDVGAMSTAPYLKTQISEEQEAERLSRAIRILKKATDLPLSADTSRSIPAKAALEAGARYLNDVTGFHRDPHLAAVARRAQRVILMAHPLGLRGLKSVRSPIEDVMRSLQASVKIAQSAGIPEKKLVIDPGIGFFRDTRWPWWKWDLQVLQKINQLCSWKYPVLIGVSRKSFIGALLNQPNPNDRLAGSLSATIAAIKQGVTWVRTHDVKATRNALDIFALFS